jgi:hypothetical protein
MGKYMLAYGPEGGPAMMKAFMREASEEQMAEWERQGREVWDEENGPEGLHWRFYAVCGRKED